MPRQVIMCDKVTSPRVPLSHAVKAGGLVFVSGTTPFYGNRELARGDFAAQMHQVMANIKAILEAAGTTIEKMVKVNVILTRISDFEEMNGIYRSYFPAGNYPARTTIEARLAADGILLEIECVAEQ
jgi:2-iminobutanoate/2-iminopropanoate deaminase